MVTEPSVAFTYGFPIELSDDPPAGKTRVPAWTVWSGHDWIAKRRQRGANCIQCPQVVMRASVQHAIGGYDAALPRSRDLEMWMRAALVGDVGRVNGAAQGFYLVHEHSMQRTVYTGYMTDLEARLDAFDKVLRRPDAPPPNGKEHLAGARRAIARAAMTRIWIALHHDRAQIEPVDDYLALAERVWPEARGWRRWRATWERPPGVPPIADHRGARLARTGVVDLAGRICWRRSRWSGV